MANDLISPTASLEERRERAAAILAEHQQLHLLDPWSSLSEPDREALLRQIEEIDFGFVEGLYRKLIVRKEPPIPLPPGWAPAEPIVDLRSEAREIGVHVLSQTEQPLYGLLIVAGGS